MYVEAERDYDTVREITGEIILDALKTIGDKMHSDGMERPGPVDTEVL